MEPTQANSGIKGDADVDEAVLELTLDELSYVAGAYFEWRQKVID